MWTIGTGHGLRTVRISNDWYTYRPVGGDFFRQLFAPLRRAWDLMRTRAERRRHIAELRDLDDWMLADIGIDRAEIPHVVDDLMQRESAELDSRLSTCRHADAIGRRPPNTAPD